MKPTETIVPCYILRNRYVHKFLRELSYRLKTRKTNNLMNPTVVEKSTLLNPTGVWAPFLSRKLNFCFDHFAFSQFSAYSTWITVRQHVNEKHFDRCGGKTKDLRDSDDEINNVNWPGAWSQFFFCSF